MSLEEIILEQAEKNKIPLSVFIEITRRCNLRCHHCYVRRERGRKELKKDEILNLLEILSKMGTLFLILSGGEPFMRRDISDILQTAKKLRFAVTVLTNGTIVPRELEKILAHPFRIGTTLLSIHPEKHDSFVGMPGAWKRTFSLAKRLSSRGTRVEIKTPVLKLNSSEIPFLKRLAEKTGAKFAPDEFISPDFFGKTSPLKYSADEQALEKLIKKGYLGNNDGKNALENLVCNAGKTSMAVDAYGDVRPCIQINEVAGNIRETSLEELWLNADVFKKYRKMDVKDLAECQNCSLRSFCQRCAGLSLVFRGSPASCNPVSYRIASLKAKVYDKIQINGGRTA